MKWSLKIGRWFGIPVQLHFTFVLLLGLLAVGNGVAGGSAAAGILGTLFFVALFGCVLLHEFGHALMARRFGVGTKDITLLPIGGVARLERMPEKPAHELWIALAGPAVNFAIAGVLGASLLALQWVEGPVRETAAAAVQRLLAMNIFLAAFNLLPAFPMDGGRVLRALLARRLGLGRATRIAGRVGIGMAAVFGCAGLLWNPFLLLIAAFVWLGAAQEMRAVETRSALAGVTAGQAMVTEFRSAAPEDRLGTLAQAVLSGSQHDFPVIREGVYVGLVERQRLFEALAGAGLDERVEKVMTRGVPTVRPEEWVEDVLARENAAAYATLPVIREGRLAGLLTMENIGEVVSLRTALGAPEAKAGNWRELLAQPRPSWTRA